MYGPNFDRIHGLSSDNLIAYLSTGAFKAVDSGAPSDLDDLQRCLHKILFLCAQPELAPQSTARLNDLCAASTDRPPTGQWAKTRFRCLLQNVNVATCARACCQLCCAWCCAVELCCTCCCACCCGCGCGCAYAAVPCPLPCLK